MAKPRIRYNYPVEIALVGPSQTSKEGRAGNKPLAKVTLAAKHPQKGRHSKGGQGVPHWRLRPKCPTLAYKASTSYHKRYTLFSLSHFSTLQVLKANLSIGESKAGPPQS